MSKIESIESLKPRWLRYDQLIFWNFSDMVLWHKWNGFKNAEKGLNVE